MGCFTTTKQEFPAYETKVSYLRNKSFLLMKQKFPAYETVLM